MQNCKSVKVELILLNINTTKKGIRPTNPILGEQIFIDKLREQFFELRGFGVVDVVDDIGKPFMGIDLILFAGAEETVKHGDVLSRFMVARKEVIFSA